VDMFSQTEEEYLNYLWQGCNIQAASMDEAPNLAVPDLFQNKIPASFMGSCAWALDQVADLLAIRQKLLRPSIFITMITNP
jgi:hypothetical protein